MYSVNPAYPQFSDNNGELLDGGKIFIGQPNQNPETSPVAVYWDEAGTLPAAQPLKTINGYIVREGTPAAVYTVGRYSITVRDNKSQLIYTNADTAPVGFEITAVLTGTGPGEGADLLGFKQPFLFAVARTVQDKLEEHISPIDFGAIGDGVTDDTTKFNDLQSEVSGAVVDLIGKSYLVSSIPSANYYKNGKFVISAGTMNMFSAEALLSDLTDTGGVEPAYTGGVNNTPTTEGRTTRHVRALIASQNCRATFARSINIASIYSWAYGNVSGNYSARQCVAGAPQAVNSASEECEVYGFRGANIVGHYSEVNGGGGGNFSTRYSSATGRHAVNIASVSANAGYGKNARLTATVAGGVVTGVTIVAGGSGYENGAALSFYDRIGGGSGALATATVDSNGAVTGISVTNGGAGYSDSVAVVVDAKGDYSANVATANGCKTAAEASANVGANNSQVFSIRSANVATDGCVVAAGGEASANVASSACEATGSRATNIASSGSKATGAGALVLSGNICEAAADGAVVFGRRTINNITRALAYGDAVSGSASTANRKWQVTANGNVSAAGVITGSVVFTDYAEYFENLTPGSIPLGMLVTLEGRKVRPAQSGDDILGVVSGTALIVAGDSPFQWSQRHLTGEFGELLYEQIPDPDWQPMVPDYSARPNKVPNPAPRGTVLMEDETGLHEIPDPDWQAYVDDTDWAYPLVQNPSPQEMVSTPIENPDYDPAIENVPRSERPDDWTCVGLLGQVHVRVDADVLPGDFIAAEDGGIGTKFGAPTNMRCMEIKREFDQSKGYAVAFCLIR